MKANEIYIGNCIDRLKEIAENSVDLVYRFINLFTILLVVKLKLIPSVNHRFCIDFVNSLHYSFF